jgi:hypothetical protein
MSALPTVRRLRWESCEFEAILDYMVSLRQAGLYINWIKKEDPTICCLQETHHTDRNKHRLRMKG